MNYEIAKKLKEKKFPMLLNPYEKGDAKYFGRELLVISDRDETYLIPTLEELIEACGETFYDVQKLHPLNLTRKSWVAEADENQRGYGDSPSEAVANLWLILHEKDD